ncbi:MAG: hypothetical protein AB7F74_18435 [Parvibaculaceae bacterium]
MTELHAIQGLGDASAGRRPDQAVLVRTAQPHGRGSYEQFDYVPKDAGGYDISGAEDVVPANWAGRDIFGRLMVAVGGRPNIYQVKPGKPLPEPVKVLDLDAAL